MRKILACFLLIALVLSLAGCGGNGREVTVLDMESELYTQEDYLAAVETVKSYFRNFQGCTMKEISYAGDEKTQKEQEYILGFPAIILFLDKTVLNRFMKTQTLIG